MDLIIVYEDDLDFSKEQRRKTFLRNLVSEGLELEIENPDPVRRKIQDIRTHFVKIHAPWPVLTKYAEIMNMKMPIKNNNYDS
ncbi:Anoctamin-5 [Orchesella cincta]|uniref:Anoctamin-5 n=1 Tax=Orchesella cincta TaxID=48709 RepID=A0A1D2NFY7_ORCCI|nr:Anoctamin-5 [Orchesella cincta]